MKKLVITKLFEKYNQLQQNGTTNIKEYECAFQDVIEKLYPGVCWWQATKCEIFNDMFFGDKDPTTTIMHIADQLNTLFIITGALGEGKFQYYHKENGWVDDKLKATLYLTNRNGIDDTDALHDWWKITNNGKICPKPFIRTMIANYDLEEIQ